MAGGLHTTPRTWVAGETPTATNFNTEVRDALASLQEAWTAYTPTWTVLSGTNPTLGNGTIAAAYMRVGQTIHFRINVTFGSTTAKGSGVYLFGLPVAAHAAYVNNTAIAATGYVLDTGVIVYPCLVRMNTSTTVLMDGAQGGAPVSATSPLAAPATGDSYSLAGTYEAA